MASVNKYALVTGAASGIGKFIAKSLADRNYHLLLVDMDKEQLEVTVKDFRKQYFNIVTEYLVQDISEIGAVEKIIAWTEPYHAKLQIVVNNAGYGLNGRFEEIDSNEQLNIIDTNLKALIALSYAYIPVLRQLQKTYLLNVASTTAYQSVPYLSVYAASKAGVLSFTRSLRYELRKSNISVSCLSPGSTDTNFVNRAGMGVHIKKVAARVNMTPQSVAEIAIKGMFAGKSEIIPGFINVLNAYLPKFVPKIWTEKIAGNIYEPRE